MWKLLQLTVSPYNFINRQLLKNGNIYRLSIKETISNHVKTEYIRSINKAKPAVKLLGKTSLIVGFSGIIHTGVRKYTVECQAKKSRTVGYREASTEINFDWKLFWYYIRPHILYLIAAITGALAVAILNIQIPQLIGSLINVIVSCKGTTNDKLFIDEIKVPALKLVMFYTSQSLCTFFYIYMLSKLGENVAYNMKKDLFASILKQDIAFFDSQRTGEIINRLTSDVQDFKSSFKQTVSGGLRAITQIIGCSLSLVLISPEMTMVTLACVPAVIGVGTVLASFLRNISSRAQAQNEKSTAVADEAVANIRTVRSFAMEEYEEELYNAEAKLSMELNESLGFGIGWFQAGTNMFLNSMVLATLYMGGYLLTTNKLSPGDLMTYLMATQTVQRSLAQISQLFGAVLRGMASGSRIFDYMKLKPKLLLKGGESIQDADLRGFIEFRNVSFSYPTRPQQRVLSNFNLTIPSGKTVAIVGASGNGKSTVVALIERFYDVNNGSISLDGKDIKKLDPNWLRSKVLGLISQEPILFGTSIMENIRYGKPDATDEEVRNAAHLANADQFIETFPRKYNTLVGERGVTLSGGQKQRIAIARALLKNPTILLLDEATSALDAESEKIVQSALDNARQGRTVLVIAHRLSTVKNADIIVVLNKGRIVETGTHEALLKLKGYYWSLVYQQQETTAAG